MTRYASATQRYSTTPPFDGRFLAPDQTADSGIDPERRTENESALVHPYLRRVRIKARTARPVGVPADVLFHRGEGWRGLRPGTDCVAPTKSTGTQLCGIGFEAFMHDP